MPWLKFLVRLVGISTMAALTDPVHGMVNPYHQKLFEEFGVKSHRRRGGMPGGLESKRLHIFFECDVPATPATYNPVPPRLLARIQVEFAALQAIPAVANAALSAQRTYRAPSYQVDGDDLDARFHSLRARFQPAT